MAALAIGTGLLMPVFATNAVGSVPTEFFTNWDHFSESLVLAKIESTTPGAIAPGVDRSGLLIAAPIPVAPYETFDGLRSGAKSTSTSYGAYPVQLGLQGFLFTAVYDAGCRSVGCLEAVNAATTAATVIGFAMLLSLIAPRSFAFLFLASTVGSPWLVSAARNLYWVPWTWFLPAMAAICFVRATGRRNRVIAGTAIFALFALRFSMGFEYLTSLSLLAAGIPLLASAFGRHPRARIGRAVRDALTVFGLSVAAFIVVLLVTGVVGGNGNLATGLNTVYQYALVRTYGGTSTDPVTALSLTLSPVVVLQLYVFNWATNILSLGFGDPLNVIVGPHGLFPMIAASVLIVLARAAARDRAWRTDLVVLAVGLAAPISWIVLAKSHSFVHQPINFVLWYLLGITSLLWIIINWAREKLPVFVRYIMTDAPVGTRGSIQR